VDRRIHRRAAVAVYWIRQISTRQTLGEWMAEKGWSGVTAFAQGWVLIFIGVVLVALLAVTLLKVPPKTAFDPTKWPAGSSMATVSDRSFTNEVVVIDGKLFHRVHFTNVTFMFHGTAPFTFGNVKVTGNVRFQSDSVAMRYFLDAATDFKVNAVRSGWTGTFEVGAIDLQTGAMRLVALTHFLHRLPVVHPQSSTFGSFSLTRMKSSADADSSTRPWRSITGRLTIASLRTCN
jgi:hypothetical protein